MKLNRQQIQAVAMEVLEREAQGIRWTELLRAVKETTEETMGQCTIYSQTERLRSKRLHEELTNWLSLWRKRTQLFKAPKVSKNLT